MKVLNGTIFRKIPMDGYREGSQNPPSNLIIKTEISMLWSIFLIDQRGIRCKAPRSDD